MDVALPIGETSHDFFRRARARLTLNVPAALDDHAAPATRGDLDLYLTFPGYRILPTVARVRPDYQLVLCEAEVADAFEVPLAFLMDAQNHALHSRDWKGIERKYYAMPFGERYIWGVTAGILRNLYERIYQG